MKAYLQMLIWTMLFAIVIEMIFPDSAYRKYLKLILGCILVYTLLSPLIHFVQADENHYDYYVKYYQEQLEGSNEAIAAYNSQTENQEQQLKACYEEGVKALVEEKFEVSVEQVGISWQADEMKSLELLIGEKQTAKKIEMGTIHIGDKSRTVNGEEENLKNKIKTCLSDFYNVQVCNIHITVQKN